MSQHVPVMLWASGTFHHPRQLHDNGQFVVECCCGAQVQNEHLNPAIKEMAMHCEMSPGAVIDRVV